MNILPSAESNRTDCLRTNKSNNQRSLHHHLQNKPSIEWLHDYNQKDLTKVSFTLTKTDSHETEKVKVDVFYSPSGEAWRVEDSQKELVSDSDNTSNESTNTRASFVKFDGVEWHNRHNYAARVENSAERNGNPSSYRGAVARGA